MRFDAELGEPRALGIVARCADEDRTRAYGERRLDVRQLVADERHAVERLAEVGFDSPQEARLRLAARAAVLGTMRTIIDPGDPATGRGDGIAHPRVDRLERFPREQAPADAGLIRCDDDVESRAMEPGDRLEAPRERMPLVRRLHVLVRVRVDHAVT